MHWEVISVQFNKIIFHVGTNNLYNSSARNTVSDVNHLIDTSLLYNPNASIAISSILYRPKDHIHTFNKVKEINQSLEKLCLDRNIHFVHSYKTFAKCNLPVVKLYAKDQLHLSPQGTATLRSIFINEFNNK